MSRLGSRSKVIVVVVAVIAAAILIGLAANNNPKKTGSTSQTTGGTSTSLKIKDETQTVTPTGTYIETPEFKYLQPEAWAPLSQKVLDVGGAASGIGRPNAPAATFTIKVANATPANKDDLRNSTLNELKKFSNFQLISVNDTKVDGKSGADFLYTFSDKGGGNKVRQHMYVIINKGKTFFLLFASADSSFGEAGADFGKILTSFKFK